jgi:hypothetical protein
MRTHVSDRRGLPGRTGSSHRRRRAYLTRSRTPDKPAANLPGDAELATREGTRPGDCITRPAIPWSFGLEQTKHPLRAVRRPRRDDPPVSLAQRLRRTHAQIVHPSRRSNLHAAGTGV